MMGRVASVRAWGSGLMLAAVATSTGCSGSAPTCQVEGGILGAEPIAAPRRAFSCDWNGRRDKPALFITTGDRLVVTVQLAGAASSGGWIPVAWNGSPPVPGVDPLWVSDQPLSDGQAALFGRITQPSTVDLPSTGGGTLSLAGAPLPNTITPVSQSIVIDFMDVQLAAVDSGSAVLSGRVELGVGLTSID